MKSSIDCIPCFVRQAADAVRMSTSSDEEGKRLMRAVLSRLHDDEALVAAPDSPIVEVMRAHGLLEPAPEDAAPREWSSNALARELVQGLTDARTQQSVAFNVDQTVRVASAVRDRVLIGSG